nr:immunoglobulin heavy chain junction region [Mus musculus]
CARDNYGSSDYW